MDGMVGSCDGEARGDLEKVVRLCGPEMVTFEPDAEEKKLAWWRAGRVGGVFPAEGQHVWRFLAEMSLAPSRN